MKFFFGFLFIKFKNKNKFMEFNINYFNFTPLIYAARDGQKEIVELLLAQPGIEINCKNI